MGAPICLRGFLCGAGAAEPPGHIRPSCSQVLGSSAVSGWMEGCQLATMKPPRLLPLQGRHRVFELPGGIACCMCIRAAPQEGGF